MAKKAWDNISNDLIEKSFRVCGQMPNINVDDIVAFKEGREAEYGKAWLEELLKLDLMDLDLEFLEKETEKETVHIFLNKEFVDPDDFIFKENP